MDNKEFEKKLEKIKTFNEVPISVDEKIQKAFQKIDKNEKEVKKEKGKFTFSKVLSLAASFLIVVFLAGNGVAYAKGEDNIYSWILEKIGIQEEYEEIKTESTNQTMESNEIKITLLDCGYDSRVFMARYKIEDTNGIIKQNISNFESETFYFDANYKFHTNNNQEIVNPDKTINNEPEVWEKISDYEYIVCDNVIISEVDWDGIITDVEINVREISNYNQDIDIDVDWNFKVDKLNDKYHEYKFQELDINKNIDEELRIVSIRVVDSGVWGILEIYEEYLNSDHILSSDYIFEVQDMEKNKLGVYEMPADGLGITHKYMPHLTENEEYKILIYKGSYDEFKEEKLDPIYTINFIYNIT